ncbi:LysE family translocator [Salininema proteolyticum]|uniref:LysE family translocator n=1 Tax=Salininema proteolyticum TaxID=1607685 RepID=A0ABV8TYN2_9ACTN
MATALVSFALVAGLITIMPGVDTALVLRSAVSKGSRFAFSAALGIQVGCLVWGAAAAVGASALLAASQTAYRAMTFAGAAYLVFLGAKFIKQSFSRELGDADAPPLAESSWRAFGTGLLTNILNPKIGVFYLAAIPQFIPDGTNPLAMGLLLALVHDVIGILWLGLIILATAFAAKWMRAPKVRRVTDRVTGVALIGFGAKLALDHR